MPSSRTADLTSSKFSQSELGNYYVATNPTPGTAVAAAITTSFSATAGLLTLRNGSEDVGANARTLFPDYIRLRTAVAPASATQTHFAITADDITRYSSGGSAITEVNPNMGASNTSAQGIVHFGALVLAAASSNVRIVSRGTLRSVIEVVNDNLEIRFGGPSGGSTLGGTVAQQITVGVPPVVLDPGSSLQLHAWRPSNAATAAEYEFEIGWFEK